MVTAAFNAPNTPAPVGTEYGILIKSQLATAVPEENNSKATVSNRNSPKEKWRAATKKPGFNRLKHGTAWSGME